jgi:hypothetical protein
MLNDLRTMLNDLRTMLDDLPEMLDDVLRGEPRFGLNDAAERAMRDPFSSPMKDGKRVKTWFPQTIAFEP